MRVILTGKLLDGTFKELLEKEMGEVIRSSVLLGKNEVAKRAPVGVTGHLRQGINALQYSPFKGAVGTLGPAVRYDYFAEEGRAPGRWPSYEPIELYVRRKIRPHVLAVDRETRKVTKRLGKSAAEKRIQQVTFLLRRKIGEHGTKGARMFMEGEVIVRPYFEKLAREAQARIDKAASDK